MRSPGRLPRWVCPSLLVALVLTGTAWVLTFPHSPEDWTQLGLLRSRTLLGSLRPFDGYPYYRPVWFAYLKLTDLCGLDGPARHAGPLALHLGGVLLVYRLQRLAGRPAGPAFLAAALLGIAPGTAAALSWLAAGNKAFTFFFLALGGLLLWRARTVRGVVAAIAAGVVPALGSSENAYLVVLLFPGLRLARPPRGGRRREAGLVFAVAAVLAWIHLRWLSPQVHAAAADDRVSQLLAAAAADPLGWAGAVAGNLGRYLLHGIGVAADAPRAGAAVLAALLVLSLARPARPGLRAALCLYLCLNLPASLFPGESSRHQGYLPALGAGLLCAEVLLLLPRRGWIAVPAAAAFLVQGWNAQRPWSDYLHHSDRVWRSTRTALPAPPGPRHVTLLNVPLEYRAAFELRLGPAAKVADWASWTIPATRRDLLLPATQPLPPDAGEILLEYDGRRIRRSSFAELADRARAPAAWFLDRIDRFDRPYLGWGEILASRLRLEDLGLGFEAAARVAADPAAKRRVEVLDQRLAGATYVWKVEADLEAAAWLVLGWTPLALPPTENATIFWLHPLPWMFRVTTSDLDRPRQRREIPVHPVLGLLPALWLEPGKHRLRVELRLRGR